MTAKKITLNELRSIVKQLVKESEEKYSVTYKTPDGVKEKIFSSEEEEANSFFASKTNTSGK